MDEGQVAVLIIIAILVGFILIIVGIAKGGNSDKKSTSSSTDSKTEPINYTTYGTSSTVHVSDEFKSDTSSTSTIINEVKKDDDNVTKILIDKGRTSIWICPNCEVENSLSNQQCCVCHYRK